MIQCILTSVRVLWYTSFNEQLRTTRKEGIAVITMRMCIAPLMLCLLVLPSASSAERILVEAEDYSSFYNIYGGDIYTDDYRIYGIDYPGEWAEYNVSSVIDLGSRMVAVRVWGDLNVQYHLQVSVTPENEVIAQTIDVYFVGKGRCGS